MDEGIGAQAETLPATRQARKQRIDLTSHGSNRRFKPGLCHGVVSPLEGVRVEPGALCVKVRTERNVQGRDVAAHRVELRVVERHVPPQQERHGERRHAKRPE